MELRMGRLQRLVLGLLVVYGLCVQSSYSSTETEWKLWKQKFNKSYKESEEKVRKDIWLDHYKVYKRHNQKRGREYVMEMNEFADQILPRNLPGHVRQTAGDDGHGTDKGLQFVPSSWDWREHGAVTPVKNQGMSSAVAAIVVTESVESYTAIKNGTLTALSYIETAQCCLPMPILSADVFKCIHGIGGLCSATSYPSTASTCKNDSCIPVGKVNGGKQSPRGDEDALKAAVYSVPVMAGIDASHTSFQLYRSGVYSEPRCTDIKIDHAIQIVGYGSLNGKDYWICKNSWGVNWGMDGYVLMARNKGNMCGIATSAFYPV